MERGKSERDPYPVKKSAAVSSAPNSSSSTTSRHRQSESAPAEIISPDGAFPSPTPRYHFGATPTMQDEQLATNPLMRRFATSRKSFAGDPYRPGFHFVSPESSLNDPNGLCYWKGRWHLFYQAYPPDEFPDWADKDKRRQHWGHAVSEDLIHWRDLPYAIYPGVDKMVFSGTTLVEEDRVIALYPGIGIGQPSTYFTELNAAMMVATSSDPLLLNWDKLPPVEIPTWDTDIWKQGATYYALIGDLERYSPETVTPPSRNKIYGAGVWPRWLVWKSEDLKSWLPAGDLLAGNTPFSDRFDDGACPNFQKIGDKWIMLFFSHVNGAQYFLGDYNENDGKFMPYDHGRFNHGQYAPGGGARAFCSYGRQWRRHYYLQHQCCKAHGRMGPDHVVAPTSLLGRAQAS